MKRHLFLVFFLSTISFAAQAQTDSSAVPFVAYWSTGDAYNFKVTKIKQKWTNEILTKNDTSQYVAHFEVIDSADKSYKIKWTFENNLINTRDIPKDIQEKFSAFKQSEIIYTTTELGEFRAIENWEEFGTFMKEMFDTLIDSKSGEDGLDKEKFRAVMQPIMAAYTSREGLEQVVFKELQYFHFPFGMEYAVKDTLEYEETLPNLLGGTPIKGKGKLF